MACACARWTATPSARNSRRSSPRPNSKRWRSAIPANSPAASSSAWRWPARDSNHVAFVGATLQVVGAPLTSGQSAPVAIRQHDIQLSTQAPSSPQNVLKAIVTRQVYLGVARDYMVEVADGTALRVTTPT